MEKQIKLGNVELKLQSSLFTIIEYKKVFGNELFKDVKIMDSIKNKEESFSEVIDVVFKITYVLNRPYTKVSYDDFLKQFDFEVISDISNLEILSVTIAEMLGTLKGGNQSAPQP